MSVSSIPSFDRTVQKTNQWLDELMASMGWFDPERAYLALRTTLHTLRDRLTVEEAAELGAQLPMLVRGFYYEGWRPTGKPVKERHKDEFLAHIDKALAGYDLGSSEEIARGVFRLLNRRVSEGEMEDVQRILPQEIRELFH
jgi:uncharacterized protein (DUF2267 family)